MNTQNILNNLKSYTESRHKSSDYAYNRILHNHEIQDMIEEFKEDSINGINATIDEYIAHN